MTDIALESPTPSSDATSREPRARPTSALLGVLAVVVLGGATTALFALEACAENSPAQPIPATAPTTTTSSSAKPPVTAPPAPTPPLPPPPT
jgi:hypothetical protein